MTLTTISGVLNLFTTGWLVKKYGVKLAMVAQTFWPCLRNLCQITAGTLRHSHTREAPVSLTLLNVLEYLGGRVGIYIMQYTQLITILGGGAGTSPIKVHGIN
jgi:hypothetical protein